MIALHSGRDMGPRADSRDNFDVFPELSSDEDDLVPGPKVLKDHSPAVLRELPISQSQNRQFSSISTATTIDSLISDLSELRLEDSNGQKNPATDKLDPQLHPKKRLVRPALAASTFEVLETVPEDSSRASFVSAASGVSARPPQRLELPGKQGRI
jgi:hypothetical protein